MRVLKQWAEDAIAAFERRHRSDGCRCHISPPCSYCTHPDNPLNIEEDDDAWEDVFDAGEMADSAMKRIIDGINASAEMHLAAIKGATS